MDAFTIQDGIPHTRAERRKIFSPLFFTFDVFYYIRVEIYVATEYVVSKHRLLAFFFAAFALLIIRDRYKPITANTIPWF
jgi:hypothetical protein